MTSASAGKCAACGKEGDGLKTCAACKLVKYCGAACQRAHRPKHARECRARAAEILQESLFDDPPPREECPICFLPLPLGQATIRYQVCCGKNICTGCIQGVAKSVRFVRLFFCPFCRSPGLLGDDEFKVAIEKRMEANDANAFSYLADCYSSGRNGMEKDPDKAMRLWLKAGKLGCAEAYRLLGCCYGTGTWNGAKSAKPDWKKEKHYYMLAAIGGDALARHNLGMIDSEDGDTNSAMKHFSISAGAGCDASLKKVREGYIDGQVSKASFEKALRAHGKATDEMRSDHREAAALFHPFNV